jgi:hypothetical protein
MKHYLNADKNKTLNENKITNEIHLNIGANTILSLEHDIFFVEDIVIESILDVNHKIVLQPTVDFEYEEFNELATTVTGRNCFNKLKFYNNIAQVSVTYHAYGDYIKADFINEISNKVEETKEDIDDLDEFLNDTNKGLVKRVETVEDILDTITVSAKGNGSAKAFSFTGLPTTIHNQEVFLNWIPLDSGTDYTWSRSGTTGKVTIISFTPTLEDTIILKYRS